MRIFFIPKMKSVNGFTAIILFYPSSCLDYSSYNVYISSQEIKITKTLTSFQIQVANYPDGCMTQGNQAIKHVLIYNRYHKEITRINFFTPKDLPADRVA